MTATLDQWRRLLALPGLMEDASGVDPGSVADVAALRRLHDATLVGLALDLAAARRKAATKWPGRPIVADPAGVEMATGATVGAHKARRLAAAGDRIVDLCCGIGGDAMALADAELEVEGVDASDVRAWMCGLNAGCRTRVADVRDIHVEGLYHLDPSRRTASGRRIRRYEDLEPGPETISRIAAAHDGAVKLGPGVDLDALPPGEVEMIAESGTLVQAVLWTGSLASSPRRATVLPIGASIAGAPASIPIVEGGAHLLAIDSSVERAGLVGNLADSLGVAALHPRLGLLAGDAPIASPFGEPFRLVERMAWRPRRVREWLRAHDAGIVEVKTRGKAVEPDRTQAELRGDGSTPYTVFVLRFDRRLEAIIAQRT